MRRQRDSSWHTAKTVAEFSSTSSYSLINKRRDGKCVIDLSGPKQGVVFPSWTLRAAGFARSHFFFAVVVAVHELMVKTPREKLDGKRTCEHSPLMKDRSPCVGGAALSIQYPGLFSGAMAASLLASWTAVTSCQIPTMKGAR